jgi:glucose/arabinose dehydrogenase
MIRLVFITLVAATGLLAACGSDPDPSQYGPDPNLPEQQRGLLPSMSVASPTGWGDERPTVPPGYTVTAIATDLKVPRQALVLPHGGHLSSRG